MDNREIKIEELSDKLLDIHCKHCDGESYGCVGCCIRSTILDTLNSNIK